MQGGRPGSRATVGVRSGSRATGYSLLYGWSWGWGQGSGLGPATPLGANLSDLLRPHLIFAQPALLWPPLTQIICCFWPLLLDPGSCCYPLHCFSWYCY